MGISLFIGRGEEVRLTNAVTLNEVLNEVSQYGEYPQLLLRSWSEGYISHDYDADEPTLFNGSINALLGECEDIKASYEQVLSEEANYVVDRIIEACRLAKRRRRNIEIG